MEDENEKEFAGRKSHLGQRRRDTSKLFQAPAHWSPAQHHLAACTENTDSWFSPQTSNTASPDGVRETVFVSSPLGDFYPCKDLKNHCLPVEGIVQHWIPGVEKTRSSKWGHGLTAESLVCPFEELGWETSENILQGSEMVRFTLRKINVVTVWKMYWMAKCIEMCRAFWDARCDKSLI